MTHATQQYTPIQWVGLLYHRSHAPTGWIEFRFLPDRTRFWMPHPTFEGQKGELTLSKLPQGQNAYWGISIRKERGKGGATDVHPTHLVWADIDLKGTHYLGGDLNPQEWDAEELREAAQLCMADTLSTCATHGLNPRAVVYTGHGLQVYFARTVRTTTEDTERFNSALANLLHGDEKTVDVARIFRLPGSQNLKNPSRPLPVEVWHADPDATTPEDRLLALLPTKTPALKPTPLPSTTNTPHEGSVIEAWNQRYSIHDMLQRYGYRKETPDRYTRPGEGASGHDVAILKNSRGVPCSFHHSSNDPVANSPLDGHLCEPFDLYAHYEHQDDWKAATRAAANHLGMKPPRKEGKLTAVSKGQEPRNTQTPAPTAESEGFDFQSKPPSIYIQNASYWIDRPVKKNGEIIDWTPEQLTNWIWIPERKLIYPDNTLGEEGTLHVNGRPHKGVQLTSLAWSSRRDLLESIGGYQAICFTTDNKDIAKIQQYIVLNHDQLPTAYGVQSYGLHEHQGEWLEIFEDRVISHLEQAPIFYAGTPVDPQSTKHQSPPDATPEQIQQAREAIKTLPTVITPTTALALLGYAAASAFAPRLTGFLGHRLPFLYVAGERESGKTSGAQIVLELATGRSARISKAHDMTKYQYDLAHSRTNNLLALLDEYRPGEIDDSYLRDHHDLGVHWRGSGKAITNHSYPLNSPMIALGEGLSDDAATKSRGVVYFVKKKDRGNLPEYSKLLSLPAWAYATHLHQQARNYTDPQILDLVERAKAYARSTGGINISPRLTFALTFIAFGLLYLQEDTLDEVFSHERISACLQDGVTNTLDGENEGETNLEIFLQQLGFSLSRQSNPWLFVAPGATEGTLILRMSPCVELVRNQYREKAAISSIKLLKQYAEQTEFFDVRSPVHKDHLSNSIRGIKLCMSMAPERCDLSILSEVEDVIRRARA